MNKTTHLLFKTGERRRGGGGEEERRRGEEILKHVSLVNVSLILRPLYLPPSSHNPLVLWDCFLWLDLIRSFGFTRATAALTSLIC